jgi:Tol biopolymer transport system component
MSIAAALAAAGAALAAAPAAQAAFPGPDGRIAVHSDRSIYTIDRDGSHRVQLPQDSIGFGGLSVSADGMRIAYSASHRVHVVGVDGRGDRTLGEGDDPAFSPDGRKVAFERDYGIWVIGARGGKARSLTPAADFTHADYDPAWSPDGRRIAYTSRQQVWVMNADGSGATSLTPPVLTCPLMTRTMNGAQPTWSPDGTRIAFTGPVTCANSRGTDIWVMNADGSGKSNLIGDDGTEDTAPAFSPAGDAIAFTRDVGGRTHLFTIGAGGGTPAAVATGLYAEDGPDWGRAYTTPRISLKLRRHGSRVAITGRVKPSLRGRVTVLVTRGASRAARLRVRLSHGGRFHWTYKARRSGRYKVVASLPQGRHNLAATSRKRAVRVSVR